MERSRADLTDDQPPDRQPRRTNQPPAPAGERFDDVTPWAHDVVLEQRVLQTVRELPPGSCCVDVGGGSGRLALAGHSIRPDLSWLSLDLVAPAARAVGERDIYGMCADGGAMPIRKQCVSWIGYRSSLHYIGVERAMREAARVGLAGARLVILAKVADQFSNCPEWFMRLHRGRSIVEREIYHSAELVERVISASFRIKSWHVFYRWADYDLVSWLSRGTCLPVEREAELRDVLRDAPTARAVDGQQILYEMAGRIYSRIQWVFIEAILDEEG
jgi:hypothetical protein